MLVLVLVNCSNCDVGGKRCFMISMFCVNKVSYDLYYQ